MSAKMSKHLPLGLGFLAVLFFLAPQRALSQAPNSGLAQPLTVPQYLTELDRCLAVLNHSPIDPKAVRDLRATLPASWTVSSGNAHYTIGTEWLLGPLSEVAHDPSDKNVALAEAREKLEDYRAEAQALAQSMDTQQDTAASHARLDKILSGREFQGQQGPTWWDLLKQRIYRWIDRQLDRIFGHVRARSIGNIVAWSVVTSVGLLMLFWTLRFLMRSARQTEMDLSGATPIGRDWRRWLREAREAAGRGDYRAAIHGAYWAAIVRMEETKSLPEDRSRTPRESLKLIDKGSGVYAPLLQLTRRFELVWYGYRAATAADWDDAAQQLETLGCLRS